MLLVPLALLGLFFACTPPHDSCVVVATLDPVGVDEVGPPGFAATDGLIPAGTYRVRDAGFDLLVTLTWDDQVTPREYAWNDGDDDGVVPDEACLMDYEVRGTLEVDSGDGRYDERGSALTAASEASGGNLRVVIDDEDVRGDEVPGKELWLEVFRSGDDLRFALTVIDFGSDADYLVDTVMEPID